MDYKDTEMKITLKLITLLALFISLPIMAGKNHKASAIYSPGCNIEQIKELVGDALIKISPQQSWDNNTEGFIVTLDLDKMDYSELTMKMMKAKCYEKPAKN